MNKHKTKDLDARKILSGPLGEDWQKVFDAMGIGITASDKHGHFEIFNSKMQAITGYTPEQANACGDFSRLIYPISLERREALEKFNWMMQNPECHEVETQIQAKDGTKKLLSISTSPINYKGQVLILSVYQDITQRRKDQQALKQVSDELEIQAWGLQKTNEGIKGLYRELEQKSEKLNKVDQLKTEFISHVSHELRTPLTVTREAISQVIDGVCGEINKEQKQFLFISIEGIDRLSRLIENLLHISKIEAYKIIPKRELIHIVSLVKEVSSGFNSLLKHKGLEIKLNFSNDMIELYVDKDMIIQVFMNLIGNAIKFTPAGYIDISIVDKKDAIECAVSDTGIGISDQDLPKVFSKFEQFGRDFECAEKGTGLGLSISKGIIELHRGSIWLGSKLGQGTKVSFILPKYTPKELFKEYVNKAVAEAIKENASLSIIVFEIKNYDTLQKKADQDKIGLIMHNLKQSITNNLRPRSDISIEDSRTFFVALPQTDKKNAFSIAERLKSSFADCLSKEGIFEEIGVGIRIASLPEDANTEEDLLKRVQLLEYEE
jgi:PAS domain S-box-containing protein